MDKVLAGIVLFNSDYNRLLECLDSLENQVDSIIVLDNSPQKYENDKIAAIQEYKCCEYIFSERNLGMPEGMNHIIRIAQNRGYKWVLTMNADSIVPDNLIDKYSSFFDDESVGMICPQIIDKRRKYMKIDKQEGYECVEMCITSAACTRIDAWKNVGEFDSWLFVDLLDNDISKRMILNRWKIIKVNSVILDQEFGDIEPKSKKVELFWLKVGEILHNSNFAKFSYKKNVHPIRVYYTCRNILYLNKKFKKYGGIGYKENYNCNTFIGFLICFVVPSILRSDKKMKTLHAVVSGFRDGINSSVEPWEAS